MEGGGGGRDRKPSFNPFLEHDGPDKANEDCALGQFRTRIWRHNAPLSHRQVTKRCARTHGPGLPSAERNCALQISISLSLVGGWGGGGGEGGSTSMSASNQS